MDFLAWRLFFFSCLKALTQGIVFALPAPPPATPYELIRRLLTWTIPPAINFQPLLKASIVLWEQERWWDRELSAGTQLSSHLCWRSPNPDKRFLLSLWSEGVERNACKLWFITSLLPEGPWSQVKKPSPPPESSQVSENMPDSSSLIRMGGKSGGGKERGQGEMVIHSTHDCLCAFQSTGKEWQPTPVL